MVTLCDCLGDNFFKSATYTIEAICAKSYEDTTEKLKEIEAQILRKRNELRQFETEYRKVLTLSRHMEIIFFWYACLKVNFLLCRHWHAFKKLQTDTLRKNNLYALFSQFDTCLRCLLVLDRWCNFISYLHIAMFIVTSLLQVDELLKKRDSIHSSFTVSRPANHIDIGSGLSNGRTDDSKVYTTGEDGGSDGKDKPTKKKWFNLNLKGSDKKLGWDYMGYCKYCSSLGSFGLQALSNWAPVPIKLLRFLWVVW